MPFKSKAQQGYMFSKHPKIAVGEGDSVHEVASEGDVE